MSRQAYQVELALAHSAAVDENLCRELLHVLAVLEQSVDDSVLHASHVVDSSLLRPVRAQHLDWISQRVGHLKQSGKVTGNSRSYD